MFGIPMLYGWIAGGVLLIVTAAGSFYEGIQIESDHRDAQQVKVVQTQLTQLTIDAGRLNADSAALETKLESLNAVYVHEVQIVPKFIDRPVYHLDCIDDDGLRSINQILGARSPANPSGHDGRLRITIPLGGKDGGGPDPQAGGSGKPSE